MYSNISPIFQNDMDTCMGWSWFYECDMQLYLFAPFFVILYHKAGRKFCYVFFTLILGAGIGINYHTSYEYKLTAGIFSLETCYFMYSYYLNKPYYKISVYMLGILSGMLFIDIREYKRSKREGTNDHQKYKVVNFLHRSHKRVNGGICKRFTPAFLIILAIIGMYLATFLAFPRLVDPYGWTNNENAWYYATTRIAFALSVMIIFFYLVFDHNPLMIGCCTNKLLLILNEFIWPSYIIAPIVYMNMFCTVNESVYMTMINNIYLGMGSMICTMVIAGFVMIFYYHPVQALVDRTLRKWLIVAPLEKEKLDNIPQRNY